MGRKMGAEQDHDPSSTPKLSLFTFPRRAQESPGMLTPPIHSQASVPFQWEEAPGKPRLRGNRAVDGGDSNPKVARCLELPPRLLTQAKVSSSTASPTTVLDGPYIGSRSVRNNLSFRSPTAKKINKEKVSFGSSRWGSVKKSNNKEVVVGGGFDFLFPDVNDRSHGGRNGDDKDCTNVKITSVTKRSESFMSLPRTKSQNLLSNIYESFKQVVPWSGRRQDKLRKANTK